MGLIAGIGPAQAKNTRSAPRAETKTFDVVTHYTEPAGGEIGARCLLGMSEQECRVLFAGEATFTGTMWGEEYYDLSGADPSAFPEGKLTYGGTAYINGGVEGCGTGTGELTNLVSGSGGTHWKMHLGGAAGVGNFGDGDFTGTITCRV